MVELAATIWSDGPGSNPDNPPKSKIRAWGTWLEGIVTAFTSNGGLIYSSLAALNADLSKPANSMAWVLGDPIAANNGVYGKVGAPGAGSWTRRADLPFSFIIASDAGAGTPNAIQATTAVPVSASSLIWMNVAYTSGAGPVTVQFNAEGPVYTIKTNSGNDIVPGGLVAGMIVLGTVSGSVFRLASDQASAAIVAAAEAWANAAQAAANGRYDFPTVAAMQTANIPSAISVVSLSGYYAPGDGGGAHYKRIATPGVPKAWQKQSADGAWWELSVSDANLLHFGCRIGTFGSDNTVATANTSRLLEAADWMVAHADIRQRVMKVPDGTIELMDFQLPEEAPYMSFIGATWNNSVWLFKNLTPGVGCRVRSIETSFWFVHMLQYITGVSGDPTIIAGRTLLHLQRPAHPELPVAQRQEIDVDATVMFCKFSRAEVGIEIIGRGLRAQNNLFSVNTRCIKLGWGGPDDYQYGAGNQSHDGGFRAFQIQNNRWHSYVYAAITNDGPYADKLQGIIITGEYADIGRPIFDGVLIDGKIDAEVTQTVTEAVRLRSGSKRFLITGNFSGSVEAGRTPENLIRMYGDITAGSFTGLVLSRSRQHAIFHDGAAGTVRGLNIDGVLFKDVCLEGGNYCPVCIVGANHTGNIRNVTLDGEFALTGILRTTVSSAAITVENARRFGVAASTPYHVGAGSKYIDATYAQEFRFGADGNGRILRGAGSPAGVVAAFPGSIYIRIDGSNNTTLYIKISGNDASGWAVAALTAA